MNLDVKMLPRPAVLSGAFDVSSQSKEKLHVRSKRKSKIIKIYADRVPKPHSRLIFFFNLMIERSNISNTKDHA